MRTRATGAAAVVLLLSACTTVDFNFEGTACGVGHPCPDGLTCVASLCQVSSQTFFEQDDFETSPSSVPWSFNTQATGDTVGLNAEAAHRGDGGLRATDRRTDPSTANGGQFDAWLSNGNKQQGATNADGYPGDQFVRVWYRVNQATVTGSISLIKSEEPTFNKGQWELAYNPDGRLRIGAWILADQSFVADESDAGVGAADGTWHLLDVVYQGGGSMDASVATYQDGVLVARAQHFSGAYSYGAYDLGVFFEANPADTFSADFDDYRVSHDAPNPSVLTGIAPNGLDGSCKKVVVTLEDVFSNPRPAPFELALSGSEPIFSESDCTGNAPVMRQGSSNATVYTKATGDGLRIQNLDFVSAPVQRGAAGCSAIPAGFGLIALGFGLLRRRVRITRVT